MAKILLIDDDPDVTDAGRLVLEKAGHTVSTAHNAEAGFALIERAVPDLLVLDIMMENADDGIVLARRLRAEGYRFPIIALSSIGAVTGLDYDREGEMLPVDVFIAKPVRPAELIQKIDELLARASHGDKACC